VISAVSDISVLEEDVAVGGRVLTLARPRDPDALLDKAAFERDEFLPYWAELWPSALALARELAPRSLRGARTLELGCGLGLPALSAALAGGRVLAVDWSPDAVAFVRANAERNGLQVATAACSWAGDGPHLDDGPWDLVLLSDVLYEERNVDQLSALLERLPLRPGGEVWIADPDRPTARPFLDDAAAQGWTVDSARPQGSARVVIHRLAR